MRLLLDFFASGRDAEPIADESRIRSLYRRYRIQTIIAVTLGYGFSYTCRLGLGIVKKPLLDAGLFTPSELGLIGSALFYTYAIGKLTNGFFADHANPKRFFAFAMAASALCNIAMGFNSALTVAVILWGLNGWFQSFGAPSCVVSITQWFSIHERGRAYGIWSSAHSIGEGLTFLAVSWIVARYGWHAGFIGPGILVLLVAWACFWALQDRPQTMGLPEVNAWHSDTYEGNPSHKTASSVLRQQLSILKNPAIWVLALASASVYVTRYAIDSWGVLFCQEVRGYTLPEAGVILMLGTLAGIAGAAAFGFISDRYFDARRPPVNLLYGVFQIAGLMIFFYGPNVKLLISLGVLLYGFGTAGLITSIGGLFGTDICPKRVAGAAMGVVGVFSYVGAAIQEHISGALIQKGVTVSNAVRHYDFSEAIQFWIGCSVMSMLLAACLWRVKHGSFKFQVQQG